jgi:tetratricopeptide (TPR) repeat protein
LIINDKLGKKFPLKVNGTSPKGKTMRRIWMLSSLLVALISFNGNLANGQEAGDNSPEAGIAAQDAKEAPPATESKTKRKPFLAEGYFDKDITELELKIERKKTPLRKKAIAQSLDLLDKTPNYPQAAALYSRIGEYMTQNVEFQFKYELLQYKKDLAKFKAGETETEPTPPLQDYSETLQYYKKILTEHADYPKVEEIYFYLGRNGLETGKSLGDDKLALESIGYLNKFITKFPENPYRPKAIFMIAEFHYDLGNLADALNYYQMIIKEYPTAAMFDYAHYKLAWVYYNYQQYDDVLKIFTKILVSLGLAERREDALYKMVLDDYTATISEAGNGWTVAKDFLSKEIGEVETYKRLHIIANQMVVHDFSEDSISLVKHFISLAPNDPQVIAYWDQNLGTARFALGYEQTDELLQEMNHFFRSEGPFMTANSGQAIKEEVEDLGIKWALYTAEHYLEEALYQGRGQEYYELAIKRFQEIMAQGAGARVEQALAGIIIAHAGMLKETSNDIIWVIENVLGVAVPGNYKLPKKRSERAYDANTAALVAAGEKYFALSGRKGLKPDLQPMRDLDAQALVHHLVTLVQYMNGHWTETLATVDMQLAYDPKSMFLGNEVWMIADASVRAKDWAGLERRMKALLDAGNTEATSPAEITNHLCTGAIEQGIILGNEGRTADALGKLSGAATACESVPKKAGEAWFRLGEVAEKAGEFSRARDAYTKVSSEFGKSGFSRMAKSGLKRIRGK